MVKLHDECDRIEKRFQMQLTLKTRDMLAYRLALYEACNSDKKKAELLFQKYLELSASKEG
jgi:hypothetical protein